MRHVLFPIRTRVALLLLSSGLSLGLLPHPIAWAESPDGGSNGEIIDQGRDALGSWNGYPWYDEEQDGFRPIDVKPRPKPKKKKDPSTNSSSGGSSSSGSSFGEALANGFQFVIWWLVLPGLALLLIYLLLKTYLNRDNRNVDSAMSETIDADEIDRVEALPIPVRPRTGNLLTEARRLYEAGLYDQAIVYLYSHQLVTLDKKQLIHLAKGKTNRQYLREVSSSRPLRDLLEETMVNFEDVFFGGHELGRPRFEHCWHSLSRFDNLLQEAA